jgi:glutamyl-tRNA synthetase
MASFLDVAPLLNAAADFAFGAMGCATAVDTLLAVAGRDFGDFVVWSGALDAASYELAVVVDDLEMGVTEVVRGQDLLLSTARQMLLAEILAPHFGRGSGPPLRYFHCPLVLDEITGERLAKRTPSTTLRGLRAAGMTAAQLADKYYDRALVPRDA